MVMAEQYDLVSEEYIAKRQKIFQYFSGKECWRCGGTGRYSWCPSYRDVCFACGGAGHHFSIIGKHGYDLYRADRITSTLVSSRSVKKDVAIEWEDIIIPGGGGAPVPVVRRNRITRKVKGDGHYELTINNKDNSVLHINAGSMVDVINEEVKMADYRTTGNWMDNIIQLSLSEMNKYNRAENSITAFVALKVPDTLPENTLVVKALMPSKETLKVYFTKGWKGKNNPNFDPDWFKEYTPLYLKDINNPEGIKNLKAIISNAKKGIKVYLVCYCTNKEWCHTSLIKQACYDLERKGQ
jgi:hypothetical protein